MRTIRFTLYKNLINDFENYKIQKGVNLLSAFNIKSDILNSSFLYEYTTNGTIKDAKMDVLKMLNYFNITHKINWNINNLLIQQHNIVINDRASTGIVVEQKRKKV